MVETSALLLTNPSLTDFLSKYPTWPQADISLARISSPSLDDSSYTRDRPSFKRGKAAQENRDYPPKQVGAQKEDCSGCEA